MLRSLWTKTFRDRRTAVIGWGLGLGTLTFGILLVYPVVAHTAGLNEYVQNLPPIFLALLGEHDLLSPAGFVNAELFHFLIPFVMISCAIGVGVDVVAGALEHRTLELLLAQPVSRTRLVVEGFVAMAAVVFSLGVFVWLGLVLGVRHIGVDLPALNLLGATFAAALLALVFGSFALLLGTLARRKGACLAVAGTSVTAAFLLHTVGRLVPELGRVRQLSPFYYYQLGDPVRNGAALENAGALFVFALALLAIAIVIVRRRDLA